MLIRYSKLFLGLLLIGFICYWSDGAKLLQALLAIDWRYLGVLLLLSVVLILVSVIKWRVFLRHFGAEARLAVLFQLYLVGYFFSAFSPSYLGGDAVRSWKLGKSVGKSAAFSATLLERYTGLATMLLCGVVAVVVCPQASGGSAWAVLVMAGGLVVVTMVLLSTSFLRWLDCSVRFFYQQGLPQRTKIDAFQGGLRSLGSAPWVLLKSLMWSLLFFLLVVVNTLICAQAVGWHEVSFLEMLVVLPLILTIGSLPITPSGLGLQEGAFFFFLQGLGASPAQALGVALILRAKWLVLVVVGGIAWLMLKTERGVQ